MIDYFQAIGFGALQGITELFPISSLGHSVLLPKLVGWNVNQNDPHFVTFLVATHAATALVLFFFFFKDWVRILKGFFRSLQKRNTATDPDANLAWLLIIATIPAGILGLLFEHKLEDLFASPYIVAIVLIFNGLLLCGAEYLRKNKKETTEIHSDERISKMTFKNSLKVGFMQCLALIPGFSRTGSTITGGLLVGLSHEDAARFSFLMATPIIGAASLLKLPHLFAEHSSAAFGPTIVGAIASGIFAFLSITFLTKYFETKTLTPFAIYCILLGIVATVILVGK